MKTNSKDSLVCAEIRERETDRKKIIFVSLEVKVLSAPFHYVLLNCILT